MPLFSLLIPGLAHALPLTLVGPPAETPSSARSVVVVAVRSESWDEAPQKLVTVAVQVEDAPARFAMLIPTDDQTVDFKLIDPAHVALLETWSAPRLVRATCTESGMVDLLPPDSTRRARRSHDEDEPDDDSLTEPWPADKPLAEPLGERLSFADATLTPAPLFSDDAAEIVAWLAAEGLEPNPAVDQALTNYTDAGVPFLIVLVELEEPPAGAIWLPPIQWSHTDNGVWLPTNIGASVAAGDQETLLLAISGEGAVARLTDYPEATLELDCMAGGEADDVTDRHEAAVSEALAEEGPTAWLLEASAPLFASCRPCTTSEAISGEMVEDLGIIRRDPQLTRIRFRHDPAAAEVDPALEWFDGPGRVRATYLEPVEGPTGATPTCDDPEDYGDPQCPPPANSGCGCGGAGAGGLAASLLTLLPLLVRRRSGDRRAG